LVVFVLDATVDVGQACSDAVLMPLESGEVDGVGEVGSEETASSTCSPRPAGGLSPSE
jgi:hypothetical protein